ncbi:MAG: S46 family peptidase [Bacteroidetes bacterium]|nr:S46 family peptidase [Bacteroidota bacterium]
MLKQRFSISLLLSFFIFTNLFASDDEGMWLPMYLKKMNEKDMQQMGMKLTADDIYSINHASIKDAVVSFGGFCTGEIVSAEGLVLTNHHCGFDAIAKHSTVENDFLKNGFWAKTKDEELPNQGLTASILVYMANVTEVINSQTSEIKSDAYRQIRIQTLIDSITTAAMKGNNYVAQVKPFFKGNEYYLMVYEVYKDVRLVGTPPQSIGKFGGETDNWMWPRHTGDFSIFRIYTSPNGNPANYSEKNIPYKPKHFLPITLKGVKPGQFTMILGFPGTTDRYLTSYDLAADDSVYNPAIIEAYQKQVDVMKKDMASDRNLALSLASEFASKSNNYKKYAGQQRQLQTCNLIVQLRKSEVEFTKWVNANADRKKNYGNILNDIKDAHEERKKIEPMLIFTFFGLFNTSPIKYAMLYQSFDKKNSETQVDSIAYYMIEKVNNYFKKTNLETDKKILKAEIELILTKVKPEDLPEVLHQAKIKFDAKTNEKIASDYVDYIFKNSMLLNKEKANLFLAKPNPMLNKMYLDPLNQLATGLLSHYYKYLITPYNEVNEKLANNYKLYVKALREWKPEKNFYPNANSTLRVTYGKVASYIPRDAVQYKYYTTYDGVLDKYDPKDLEFDAPKVQLDLFKKKSFGRYGQNDSLRLCFITDTDITGGNSGSPVLDEKGRLLGLAFDGNWESMIGDLYVNPAYNRTIAVDIRYVLWVIDEFAGAQNLINEMKIEEQ